MNSKFINSVIRDFVDFDVEKTANEVIDKAVVRFQVEKTIMVDEVLDKTFIRLNEFKLDLMNSFKQLGLSMVAIFMIAVGIARLIDDYLNMRGIGFVIIGI